MRNKILIVDDVPMNREILVDILATEQYEILEAGNGLEAIKLIQDNKEDLVVILLDLVMPEMDGFGVLEWLQKTKNADRVPVLIITGDSSPESEQRCFDYGVNDFIHKPFERTLVTRRVENMIALYKYRNRLEDTVAEQTEQLRAQNQELIHQAEQLKESKLRVIDVLGTVVESRNLESGLHIQRVKTYTKILAESVMKEYPEYGLTPETINIMFAVSALHDVGKISIPDSILLKPGRLTDEEFACMKTHTIRGCEVLDNVEGIWEENYEQICYDICRYHHERYDGRGYPDGLAGDDIPISAQIVSVADVYDALVSERCYKKPFHMDEAYTMIMEGKCGIFNPKILHCFDLVRPTFEETVQSL